MTCASAAGRRAINLTIAATSLGFALVQLDVSILNVALARTGAAIDIGVTGLQWIVDAYTIAFASLLLATGAFGDRCGARRVYIGGFALFGLALLGVRSSTRRWIINRRTRNPGGWGRASRASFFGTSNPRLRL
jgi:MFS transporter, DHA2 family, methylenomycin A resistance protein